MAAPGNNPQWNGRLKNRFYRSYLHYRPVKQSRSFIQSQKRQLFLLQGKFLFRAFGTYKGKGSQVKVVIESIHLVVYDLNEVRLCKHVIALGKGQKVINTDHKRDKSSAIGELIEQV